MPWLEGRLARVLWSSEKTGYGVVRLLTAEGEVTAVGTLSSLAEQPEGAFVALEGQWEEHSVHGRQFRSTGLLEATPHTLAGLEIWLASAGVKGIGDKIAARIVARFGLDLPAVLRDHPERLRDVPGVGAARIEAIREAWARDEEGRALTLLLRGLGFSQRLADRIRQRYGDRAAHIVKHEPYRLADEIGGIGFKTADALARQLGLPPDDPARVRAAVPYVLDQESEQGHCYLPRAALREGVLALGVPVHGLDLAIDAAEGAGKVVVEGDRVWSAPLYQAEDVVARELRAMLAPPPEEPGVVEAIVRAEGWVGVQLDPSQRDAVRLGLRGGVAVVTGGPGTGKTTLLKVLLRVLRERDAEVKLASPTGRAARRLEEATGLSASTLHRLLEYNPGEGGFQRSITNPLEADALVVDEVSMVDLPLMSAVTGALTLGTSLLLVGDADQLPSVGPGQVLRDLVASGVVPVARLTTIHRQAEDSGIVAAAMEIHAGRVPQSGEHTGRDDVFLLPRPDPEEAVQTVLKVVAERLPARGFDPHVDVQVLAPTRRGPLGTERLNRELQARLNPDGAGITRGETDFRVGDRVLCTKNRYDVEVFNGDVGRIVDAHAKGLVIDFDGRKVAWEREELGLLDLAYAMTVHKSQGSEYPAVVLALHDSHGIMLRRNLFYTAATRAKRFLCVVGSATAWARAVRHHGGDERNTGLAERLRGETGGVPGWGRSEE